MSVQTELPVSTKLKSDHGILVCIKEIGTYKYAGM